MNHSDELSARGQGRDVPRVLVLTPNLSQGGGVVNYFRTLRLDRCRDVDYFSVNRPDTRSLWSKVYHACFIYGQFARVAGKYQLIHVNPSLNPKSFYRDMVFVALAKLMRKRVLVFFRGWEREFAKRIESNPGRRWLFRHTFARADRFIVLGRVFKEELHALGVDRSAGVYIETTVADSARLFEFDLERKLTSGQSRFEFLFMSRILRSKGIFIAIDAFEGCKAAHPEADLVLCIAGSGPDLEAAQDYVKETGYTGIEFHGEVSGANKARLLERCHVMIFPTCYDEGLPNCVLEGMLYGMPIVSRTNAAIPEIVKQNINGFLTESTDRAVFARYLSELVSDPNMYRRIARTNHETAVKKYSTEKVRERMLDIYRNLLCAE